jgi:outer membrane receptor protein involved in Fe transport
VETESRTVPRAEEWRVRWFSMGVRAFAASGLWLVAHAHASQPTSLSPVNPLPSHFDELLAPAQILRSSAPTRDDAGLSLFKKLEHDDLRITGFVASRNAQDAADYRVYLGLGYKAELGSLAKVTSRAFYGTGTYDGMNPNGGALPEDVRASGNLPGGWVGADWKLESQLSARHTFVAGVEYRQRLGFELLDLNGLMGRPSALHDAQPLRKVGIVTSNNVTLSHDLALKVRMRYDERTSASRSAVEPRVELVYKPEQTSTLSATFDQAANRPLSQQRAYHPWASADEESDRTRNYELAYEKSLWQRNRVRFSAYRYDVDGLLAQGADPSGVAETAGARIDTTGFEVGMERNGSGGTRARVSYAWQETTDWFATSNGSLGQHLTKLSLDIPILANRLSTSFELQHLGVVGSLVGDQNRDFFIGNLTLASGAVSSDTRLSFGMHNLFGAKETGSGARLLSFIPPDGRSLRLDVTRKL